MLYCRAAVGAVPLPPGHGYLRGGRRLPAERRRRLHPAERAAAGHPGLAGEREGVASRVSVKGNPGKSKLGAGGFRGKTDPQVDTFTSSLAIDRRLYRHDIAGSIAHCRTLERAGVLTRREADKLVAGLKQVEKEIAGGRFRFTPAHEDIHMAIEARLTELGGEVGGKLPTGRSRNDQGALDLRLYLRDVVKDLLAGLRRAPESLEGLAGPGAQRGHPALS